METQSKKELSHQLQQVKAERDRLAAELERFIYTVSHDLKAPLVSIQGYLGHLQRDIQQGDEAQISKDMEQITQATHRMAQLIEELLELSRLGRVTNLPEPVDFTVLVNEVLETFATEIKERKIAVTVAPDLPTLSVYRSRMAEVFENLISNAIKYMGDQPKPEIEVGCEPTGTETEVRFYVRDNGVGIDPAYHDQVFELFQRTGTGGEGTGVGLAIVKRVVEVHGGRIWVESAPGRGSTFWVSLPKRKRADE
ncbi:MAG: ATP-binding protein [Candidatus Bipolaricaulia bacterium]